jgi:hypothetical protein
MTISATSAHRDDGMVWIGLAGGRQLGAPLAWFPRLLKASLEDRAGVEVSPFGLHWAVLDEGVSTNALLFTDGIGVAA